MPKRQPTRKKPVMRLRLFPVLIVVAGVAFAVRLGDLWHGLSTDAQAQTVTRPPRADPGVPAPDPGLMPAAGDSQAALGEEAASGSDANAAADSSPVRTAALAPRDPLLMTDEEIAFLQALAARREELERRTRELEEREVLLQAAERRLQEKVDGLRALRASIEKLVKQREEETESQYRSLVKIYETMKPKDAARIFEELDMAVLLPVVERMKERKAAPILAKMNPEKAKAITVELAQRKAPAETAK
ncbi:MAG: hypothetical protein D6826_00665 [Alphaproteobacteria bacterium]|nr:MAG: hypothetical protein D6826_00665 [Alphaproteobacteria bacterium]